MLLTSLGIVDRFSRLVDEVDAEEV
jgi:hypothetical protein